MSYFAAILTSSDSSAAGEYADTSGAAIKEILATIAFEVTKYEVVRDEADLISDRLQTWADSGQVQLIVTTGGTGLGPRDVTPEATRAVLDYEVPGIVEAMRLEGLKHTPMSMISRAVAGVRNGTLIINLPAKQRPYVRNTPY
jgi:molybdenum cofactor synthesis domain-containing protein